MKNSRNDISMSDIGSSPRKKATGDTKMTESNLEVEFQEKPPYYPLGSRGDVMAETNINVPRNKSSPSVMDSYESDGTPEIDIPSGGFAIFNPLAQITLQNMVAPPSRQVDAVLTDLLLCSPEQPAVPLADEVFERDSPAADLKESYLGRREDVEGHKRNLLHSRQPLESASRRRSRMRHHSEQPRKRSHRKNNPSQNSSKDGASQAAAPRSGKSGLSPGSFSRSTSDPADDIVMRVSPSNELDESEEVSLKLRPISEEDVQFTVGSDADDKRDGAESAAVSSPAHRARKISSHHRMSLQLGLPDRPSTDNMAKRWVAGDRMQLVGSNLRMDAELHDDDKLMKGVDIDHVTSHRFDYHRPAHRMKRKSIAANVLSSVSFEDVIDSPEDGRVFPRQPVDHTAHDVFVEMNELVIDDDGHMIWKERARWIKYEEDVELGGAWGKPHVSTLSFHSLLELRRLLELGLPLFDIPETTVPGIVRRICAALRERGTLNENEAEQMESTLLSTLSYKGEMRNKKFSVATTGSQTMYGRQSSVGNNLSESRDETFELNGTMGIGFEPDGTGTPVTPRKMGRLSSILGVTQSAVHLTHIEKKLPEGAEKANVWVGSVQFLQAPIMVFVRLSQGIMLGTVSGVRMPVRFIFVLMGPTSRFMFSEDYVEIGRALSTLMSYKDFQNACYVANDPKDLILPMNAFLSGSVVVPAHGWNKTNVVQMLEDIRMKMIEVDKQRKRRKYRGEQGDRGKSEEDDEGDELKRTGCFGLGLIKDIKRRYPLYLSDIKDGLNFQCLSVIMFIFFAALSPAVTFGADIEQNRVNGWIGVTETIIGSAAMGAVFGLFSGQPLLIIGPTGPLAVFEGSLYDVGKQVSEENYMAFRCWVGLWLFVICTLTALLELSFVLKYFTRFTEEIFSMLVSLIYLVSVVNNLITIFQDNPLKLPAGCDVNVTANETFVDTCLNSTNADDAVCSSLDVMKSTASEYCCHTSDKTNKPNTALLSLILTVGCFIIAYFLKKFRFSPFLSKRARQTLGDFGVPIAILTMTILDVLLNDKTVTKKLFFPEGFKPTKNQGDSEFTRDWFISPFSLTLDYWWLALVAIVPAILVFFLVFIEIQITGRIISKKENNLQKGTGFHLNIFVVGLSGIICGVFGSPWVTGATVRSVSHTTACAVSDSHHAPGEKPKLSIREQRVTSVMVMVLLGLVILLKPVLKYVPYAVLYGIFVYMGVSCLGSLQIYERIKLIFMPRKNYPSVAYARDVSRVKMIVFTLIQLVIVAVLWVVKESPASIAFPFFLIMLVPLRLKILPLFYTELDLQALDNEQSEVTSHNIDDLDLNLTASMPY